MKILDVSNQMPTIKQNSTDLIKGSVPKLALNQIDNVEDVNFSSSKSNHRLSFKYDKNISKNVAQIIDNSTGKIVKQLPSASQVDHMIRMSRLMGLHVDESV